MEYTSCGVVPIITPYVGDYSEEVYNYDLGVTFNDDINELVDNIYKVIKNIHKYRQRLYNYSLKMTWENYKAF